MQLTFEYKPELDVLRALKSEPINLWRVFYPDDSIGVDDDSQTMLSESALLTMKQTNRAGKHA